MPEFVPVSTAAFLLKSTYNVIRARVLRGTIKGHLDARGKIWVDRDELERLVRERSQPVAAGSTLEPSAPTEHER